MVTGERIRQAREARGLTMADLARSAGLSPGAISRIERGERAPGSATLQRLAQALGIAPGALMDGEAPGPFQPPQQIAPGSPYALRAVEMVARVMPGLPEAGQKRVLAVIQAALT